MECLNRNNTYTLFQAVYKKTILIPPDLAFSYIVLNPQAQQNQSKSLSRLNFRLQPCPPRRKSHQSHPCITCFTNHSFAHRVASDASNTNATYGSMEPASSKQTDTSFHVSASVRYETEHEKKVRQNETLIGIGFHFTNCKFSAFYM